MRSESTVPKNLAMRYARLINHQVTFNKYEKDHIFFNKLVQTAVNKLKLQKKRKNKKLRFKSQLVALHSYVQFLPRFSGICRNKSMCFLTAKTKSVFRKFLVARIALRELVHNIRIQGLQRANW